MGEGRRDRNTNRHGPNLRIEKSSSDTEVARSKIKNRKSKSKTKGKWPFLDGITVDELGRYRRRRFQNYPKDTLGVYRSSEVIENPVTEYRYAFRATSEDSILKILEDPSVRSSHERIEIPIIVKDFEPLVVTQPHSAAQEAPKTDEDTTMEVAVERMRQAESPIAGTRRRLIRRGTSLKREGNEFYGNTESSNYGAYEGQHKAELTRRSTSLRMEGSMNTTTEQCEQFIEWPNAIRPELVRLPSNLKLEGDLQATTENHDQYVPFVGARRPEILRQIAHLQLEGESTYIPEYTDVFREHGICGKRMPVLPQSHLKTGGDFHDATESCRNYGKSIDKDSVIDDSGDEMTRRNPIRDEDERSNEEEDRKLAVTSRVDESKGRQLEIPEYKDAFKDFPRERPKLMRPEDEIGRADGSKVHSSVSHGQFQTKIDQDPEYKSKFLDTDRTIYRKPPLSLRPSAASSGHHRRTSRESQRHDGTSEVRSQYVPYGHVPRVETLRMPANLRLEGNIDMKPEYQVAYCTRRDNSMTNEPRIHRHRDRSVGAARSQENAWINNDNGEQFGRINAADEQDAFQVLNTRVHEESVVGKPPPGIRRGSRSSEWQTSLQHRPQHLDATSSSGCKNRSPSPSYRLHVQNADDEARSFENRTISPSRHIFESAESTTPEHLDHHRDSSLRSYSPSFGRNQQKNSGDDQHAFVVLDNARNDYSLFNRVSGGRPRKSIDWNCNVTETMRRRTKDRTPTNWMPPWYDNTNTI